MSYKKADKILPKELLEIIQQYVEGESIYIPRKTENRRSWGDTTGIRQEIAARNTRLFRDYQNGADPVRLADKYCLSLTDGCLIRLIKIYKPVRNNPGQHRPSKLSSCKLPYFPCC